MVLKIPVKEMIEIQENFIAERNFSGTAKVCIALTGWFHDNERFTQLKRDEYGLCLVVFFAKEPLPSEIPPLTYAGKRIKKTVRVFYEVIGEDDDDPITNPRKFRKSETLITGEEMILIQEDFIADHNFSGTARVCIALTSSVHDKEKHDPIDAEDPLDGLCLLVIFHKKPKSTEGWKYAHMGRRVYYQLPNGEIIHKNEN